MTPQELAIATILGLLVNLAGLAYTVLKVSFLAGELTEKVRGLDRRIQMLEESKQQKMNAAYAGRG